MTIKGTPQVPWSAAEIEYLKKNYAKYSSVDIAQQLGRPLSGVYGKALALKLRKDPGIVSLIAKQREAKKYMNREMRSE
jgi:hypothetical protein